MTLEGFYDLCSRIVDSEFPTKTLSSIFAISIKTQTNEINYDRHLQMTFDEFLEAYARVVDKYSPIPEGENPSDWTPQTRHEQHLSTKLFNTYGLMINCLKEEFKQVKDKFIIPHTDENALYEFDINSPLYANVYPKNLHK